MAPIFVRWCLLPADTCVDCALDHSRDLSGLAAYPRPSPARVTIPLRSRGGVWKSRCLHCAHMIQLFIKDTFGEMAAVPRHSLSQSFTSDTGDCPGIGRKSSSSMAPIPAISALIAGREYLVVGRQNRYGILGVSGCSGTKPLRIRIVSRLEMASSRRATALDPRSMCDVIRSPAASCQAWTITRRCS